LSADQDLRDTIAALLDAIGYPDEYASRFPKEKASVTFKRWFDEQLRAAFDQGVAFEVALRVVDPPKKRKTKDEIMELGPLTDAIKTFGKQRRGE
jgi:hypothetical protein